jgi:hypothetical protein
VPGPRESAVVSAEKSAKSTREPRVESATKIVIKWGKSAKIGQRGRDFAGLVIWR